jgi:hypothetical protein
MAWKVTASNGVYKAKVDITEADGGTNSRTASFVLNDNEGAFIKGEGRILFAFTFKPSGDNTTIEGQVIRRQFLAEPGPNPDNRPLDGTFKLTRAE